MRRLTRLSNHTSHLEGVKITTVDETVQEWELFKEGLTAEFPLCKRCRQHMTINDEGEKFCAGCRLSEAEEAGLKQTSMMIQQRLDKRNKTEMFRGTKHLNFCVCCCIFVENTVMVTCSAKEKCNSPHRV